jgi:probable F420-dependent oxidoreductase
MPGIGLISPIVTLVPHKASPWEHTAGVDDLVAVARTADRLGYSLMTCSEHVAIPDGVPSWSGGTRGTTFWGPLPTFGYLSACTERIRFATHTLIIGLHHPLEIAKQYGTLDRISKGRAILTVGIGSYRPEFDVLGVSYSDRARRADDALAALRVSMSHREPNYSGEFYTYDGMIIDPCAVQQPFPLWIGGHSLASLRRALRYGTGWAPQSGVPSRQIAGMLSELELGEDFEVVLTVAETLDPIGHGMAAAEAVEDRRCAGATTVLLGFQARSLAHYLEQMEALVQSAPAVNGPAFQQHPTT